MKRFLSIFLLVWACICLQANDTEPINLVFIGNSITYGANLSDPSTQAPPVKTAKMVKEATSRDVYYRNCGLSGSATPDWMPGTGLFSNADKAATDLQKAHPGVLFFSIMLGTNDTHEGWKTPAETYYQNMKTIVEDLLTRHPEAHIIVNYPTWYSPNTHNGAVYLQAGLDRLQTYMPMITRLCDLFQKSERPQVWPGDSTVYSFFENQKQYFVAENGNSGVFYLHPNTTGGTKLAEFWSKSIVAHLDDIAPLHTSDELLLDKAQEAVAGCLRVDKSSLKPENKLIAAGQLTSNGTGTEASLLDNLTDMNPNTYFEIDELSTTPDKAPWLQVDLKGKSAQQMVMTLQKRASGANWMPNDVTIYGSVDGQAWERVTGLHNMEAGQGFYASPVLLAKKEYQHLRICVHNTASLNISEGGALTWNLSELQLYAVDIDSENSPYAKIEGLKAACDALAAQCEACAQALESGALTEEQRAALSEGIAQVEALNKGEDPGQKQDPNVVYISDLNSEGTYCYNKTEGLLTDKSQITANSEEKNAGVYFGPGNLINPSTDYNSIIWHTSWTANTLPASVDNYLQAHLNEEHSSICFSMVGSNWSSTYDTPDHMVILATNTPKDESSWTQIAELPDMIPAELHNVHPAMYTSPRIDLGTGYTDIRFVIKETVNHRSNGNGNFYVSLARFQVYQPAAVVDAVKQLKMLVNQLTEQNTKIQAGTQPGYYAQEQVDAFRQALSKATLMSHMNPTSEEAAALLAELNAAYEALKAALIPLQTGYYWIQSGYPGFEEKQGEKKALKATSTDDLQWTTYDPEDVTQLFNLEADGENWKLKGVGTGEYIGQADNKSKRIGMGQEGAALAISAEGDAMFSINMGKSPVAMETAKDGTMKQGYVAALTPSEPELGTWYLVPLTDEAKAQQLAEQVVVLQTLQSADDAYSEALGCGSRALLTKGSQLYANSVMSGFPVSNLLNKGTAYDKVIFHSIWGNGALPADQYNYLQVDLGEQQSEVTFSMIGSSWSSTYDTPDDYVIMATNTPEDEDSWQFVTELYDMIPQALHTTYPAFYTSPLIDLGGAYSHLRFIVMSTVNNRPNGNGNIFFSLARFQVYGNAKDSKYDTVKGLAKAVDDMVTMRDQIKGTPIDQVSKEAVEQLQSQIDLVRGLMDGTIDAITQTSAETSEHSTYSMDGKRMTSTLPHTVYIKGGHKILTK